MKGNSSVLQLLRIFVLKRKSLDSILDNYCKLLIKKSFLTDKEAEKKIERKIEIRIKEIINQIKNNSNPKAIIIDVLNTVIQRNIQDDDIVNLINNFISSPEISHKAIVDALTFNDIKLTQPLIKSILMKCNLSMEIKLALIDKIKEDKSQENESVKDETNENKSKENEGGKDESNENKSKENEGKEDVSNKNKSPKDTELKDERLKKYYKGTPFFTDDELVQLLINYRESFPYRKSSEDTKGIIRIIAKKMAENYYDDNKKTTLIYKFTTVVPYEELFKHGIVDKVEEEYDSICKNHGCKDDRFNKKNFKLYIVKEYGKSLGYMQKMKYQYHIPRSQFIGGLSIEQVAMFIRAFYIGKGSEVDKLENSKTVKSKKEMPSIKGKELPNDTNTLQRNIAKEQKQEQKYNKIEELVNLLISLNSSRRIRNKFTKKNLLKIIELSKVLKKDVFSEDDINFLIESFFSKLVAPLENPDVLGTSPEKIIGNIEALSPEGRKKAEEYIEGLLCEEQGNASNKKESEDNLQNGNNGDISFPESP